MHAYEYDGQYGVKKTVYFSLQAPSATSSDRLVTTAPGSLFAAGDILIYKDGVLKSSNSGQPDNSVTQIGSSPNYSLTLVSNTEQNAEDVLITISDLNGPAYRDAKIHIRNKIKTGQFEIISTGIGGNVDALAVTGVGTGLGLKATGGATAAGDISGILKSHAIIAGPVLASSSGTYIEFAGGNQATDYYKNVLFLIISGTGAGQARVCISSAASGANVRATMNRSWTAPNGSSVFVALPTFEPWDVSPLVQLSALPTYSSTFGALLQFLFQRFAYKRTQAVNATDGFKMFESDGTTQFAHGGVSDDGTTQTAGMLADN